MSKEVYTIKLKTQFFEENGVIVGVAPELNVSSFGNNLVEAKRSLAEAVEGFLETCRDIGTLEQVLEEAGFKVHKDQYIWEPPKLVRQEQVDFQIEPALSYA